MNAQREPNPSPMHAERLGAVGSPDDIGRLVDDRDAVVDARRSDRQPTASFEVYPRDGWVVIDAVLDREKLGADVVCRGGNWRAVVIWRDEDTQELLRFRGLCPNLEVSGKHEQNRTGAVDDPILRSTQRTCGARTVGARL